MTFAACSLRRRCWSCASVIACSSWILGSAFSLKDELSLAVKYFHQRLSALNMARSLTLLVGWRFRTAPGQPGPDGIDLGHPVRQRRPDIGRAPEGGHHRALDEGR